MKTPDEIKKGLEVCKRHHCDRGCIFAGTKMCYVTLHKDALAYIQQLESTVSQVSKALCGKDNATFDELLKAADQLKYRLAQAERERDAAVRDISIFCNTPEVCKHYHTCQTVKEDTFHGCFGPVDCADYEYRGPCTENTKEG